MMQINEMTHIGLDKAARYGWTIKDEPGRLMVLDKAALEVDASYQRRAADGKVKRIASEWSWVACGALVVADRGDGRFFVIDGQHRALAAMKLSAVRHLPCVVFQTEGRREEASGFLRANRDRKPMTAVQAFAAMVTAGDKDAVFVQNLLDEQGLALSTSAATTGAFKATGCLLQIARRGHEHARRVLVAAIAACAGGSVHNDVLRGLGWIDTRLGDPASFSRMTPRLKAIGRDEILRSISAAKAFRNAGGEKVYAEGILNAYNHRLRNKIELP